jgi:hypothetical protein
MWKILKHVSYYPELHQLHPPQTIEENTQRETVRILTKNYSGNYGNNI